MKKNKYNPELLKEEINRFRLLETYDFYHEDKSAPEFNKIEEDEDPQTDMNSDNADAPAPETPEGDMGNDMSGAEAEISNELGVDDGSSEIPVGDMPEPEPSAEEVPMEEPVDDSVEIDITSLVDASKEAKSSADIAVQNSEIMLQKLADLETRLSGIQTMNSKIDNIEQQIVKRIPTPVEKLEMRSFDSYPYNQKLTDYWSEKEGPYDAMEDNKKKEYVLTQDDVDDSYSESEIKDSFNDYEEEEIY